MTTKLTEYYRAQLKAGYRSEFIYQSIADKCCVSTATVRGWLQGRKIRDIYFDKLQQIIN